MCRSFDKTQKRWWLNIEVGCLNERRMRKIHDEKWGTWELIDKLSVKALEAEATFLRKWRTYESISGLHWVGKTTIWKYLKRACQCNRFLPHRARSFEESHWWKYDPISLSKYWQAVWNKCEESQYPQQYCSQKRLKVSQNWWQAHFINERFR